MCGPWFFLMANDYRPMTDSSAVSHHAERVAVAAGAGDVTSVQEHLRILSELSPDGMGDTEFDAVRGDAADLADRLDDHEGTGLPEPLEAEAWAVAGRACRCCLAADGVDAGALPAVEAVAEEGAAAAEGLAERHAELAAETVVLGVYAETTAAERTAALTALRTVMETMTEAPTESEWLENVSDLEAAAEQERRSSERKQELDETLAALREKLDE